MRLRQAFLTLCLLLVTAHAPAQGLWVEAKVLVPLWVELPAAYDPSRAYPLVLLLHGRGGAASPMLTLRGRLGEDRFILAAPQGAYSEGDGFRWFHASGDPKLRAHTDTHAVEVIQRAIQALKQRYRVGGVYLLGHSQGAALAYLAAARLRSDIDGVLAFGAGNPRNLLTDEDIAALNGLPHFLSHGWKDRVYSPTEIPDRLAFWKAAHVPTTFERYPGGHSLVDAPLGAAAIWILKQEGERSPAAPRER